MARPAPRGPLTPDQRALVGQWEGLARSIVNIKIASLPKLFGPLREELRAAAHDGLIDAARRFDPSRGVPFEQYAPHRIRGELTDYLRSLDHLTKHDRAKANDTGVEAWAPPLSIDEHRTIAVRVVDLSIRPDEAAERIEIAARLNEACRTLPDRTRAALALRYVEGWSLKQIGAAMGYSESRACQVMTEAHTRLRVALAAAGIEAA